MYRPEAKFPEMLQSGSANGLVMCLCFKNQCHCRVCGCDPWTRATDIWMPCNTIVFDHLHALSDKAITKHGQKEENLVDIIPRYISSLKGMVHLFVYEAFNISSYTLKWSSNFCFLVIVLYH